MIRWSGRSAVTNHPAVLLGRQTIVALTRPEVRMLQQDTPGVLNSRFSSGGATMFRRLVTVVVAVGLVVSMTQTRTIAQEVKTPPAGKQFRKPDVIYVPTPYEVVEKMLDMANVQKGEVVYDLGCGDGRIVVAAAKRGAKATGWDINPERVKEAVENVKKNKVEQNAKIIHDDIFTLDLSGANVVTLYLLTSLNEKLIPQLEKLKPGSRIVSHDFSMPGVKPDQVVDFTCQDGGSHTIYFWTTPLKKEKKKTVQDF